MTVASDIAAFIARYTPAIAADIAEARRAVRARVPNGFELVYDNYNALVFGFAATERTRDAIISVAAYPKWVTLFFLKGASLSDPDGVLEGSGKTVRGVRLTPVSLVQGATVQALISAALAEHAHAFAQAPALRTLVKSVSAKQRPRR